MDYHKNIRIIALPFAGGSSYSFADLEHYIPDHYHWKTLELAGRGSRMNESSLTSIKAITADLFQRIVPLIKDTPYMFYGHSMGTLIGYELTKQLIRKGYPLPLCLFFTGHGAPSFERKKKIAHYDKVSFWQEIKAMGGLPQAALNNEELIALFEPIIRADFRAVETYAYDPTTPPFSIPVFIRAGDKEGITIQKLKAWQKETLLPIDLQLLPGNHFFIFDYPQMLAKQIIKALTSAIEMR
ncbi:MAG: thioesterase domain-containing protein [Bacteroidota bacterium]